MRVNPNLFPLGTTNAEKVAFAEINKLVLGVWAEVYCDRGGCGEGFAVYCGSHGGWGNTLLVAMNEALACCGLGNTWRVDEDRFLADHFREIANRYELGHLQCGPYPEDDDEEDE